MLLVTACKKLNTSFALRSLLVWLYLAPLEKTIDDATAAAWGPRPEREGDGPEMQSTLLVRHILRDEAVTRGLGDIEARMIVEWMADRAEQLAIIAPSDDIAWTLVRQLCRRARVIACFVRLYCDRESRGAAIQFTAAERLYWPLPTGDIEPGELMEGLLAWVDRQDEIAADSIGRMAA